MTIQHPENLRSFEIAQTIGLEPDFGTTAMLGDSAHQVGVVQNDDGEKWIIKPTTHIKARNEAFMLTEMAKSGVPTLSFPLGTEVRIVKLPEESQEESALIMPYVKLRPLTQLDWGARVTEFAFHELLDKHAKRAMGIAAKMHRRGMLHGDFQVKNNGLFASSNAYAKQICFDFEGSECMGSYTDESNHPAMAGDVLQFFKSIFVNRYLDYSPTPVKMDKANDFALEYSRKLAGNNEGNAEVALQVASSAVDKLEDWIGVGGIQRARRRFKQD